MFFNVSDSIMNLEINLSDSFHWYACRPLETVALRVCDTPLAPWQLEMISWDCEQQSDGHQH